MTNGGIIRPPTTEERKDFVPLMKGGKNPKREFYEKLHSHMQKAAKAGKPYCDIAAIDDWRDSFELQAKKIMRNYGYMNIDEF
jgi:hypothetical protein